MEGLFYLAWQQAASVRVCFRNSFHKLNGFSGWNRPL